MSQEKFLSQRLETIQKSQAIDIRVRDKLIQNLRELETYVPCGACAHYDGGYCGLHKATMPDEITAVGCGQGEYIPF